MEMSRTATSSRATMRSALTFLRLLARPFRTLFSFHRAAIVLFFVRCTSPRRAGSPFLSLRDVLFFCYFIFLSFFFLVARCFQTCFIVPTRSLVVVSDSYFSPRTYRHLQPRRPPLLSRVYTVVSTAPYRFFFPSLFPYDSSALSFLARNIGISFGDLSALLRRRFWGRLARP